jgi:dihydropyrimidinase
MFTAFLPCGDPKKNAFTPSNLGSKEENMKTLVKGGTIVTASDIYKADVLIEDGVISLIGTNLADTVQADTTVDATNQYVIPGGIDVHVHLDMPFGGTTSADDFESGTIAAAHGGTTSVVDFAIQSFGGSLHAALEDWHKKAQGKAAIDYSFHMIAREINEQTLSEMDEMVRREGVTSFKLFMAYRNVFQLDDASIFRAMRRTADNGGLICMHAENGGVIDVLVEKALAEGKTAPKYHALTRPTKAEGEATRRAIALSEMAGVPVYIVHLSCADALQQVREARDMGLPAYAETCPQYLFLDFSDYEKPGFEGAKYVMSPPLREKAHQDALWRGLAGNDLQVVSTDHCPFCMKEQKEIGKDDFSKIPNGAPGIETRMSLLYDGGVVGGRISLNRFVELTSTNPAKLMGLFPKKGTIAVGTDGDIVVFDPNATMTLQQHTLHMRVDYNPYEGRKVQGVPTTVLSRGNVIVDKGQFLGKPGDGKFVPRKTYQLV